MAGFEPGLHAMLSSLCDQEPMSSTNFRVAWLCYAEIKQPDWLFKITGLFVSNQSALFQCSIAMLHLNLWMTLADGQF